MASRGGVEIRGEEFLSETWWQLGRSGREAIHDQRESGDVCVEDNFHRGWVNGVKTDQLAFEPAAKTSTSSIPHNELLPESAPIWLN
jgi:hypothetical protein